MTAPLPPRHCRPSPELRRRAVKAMTLLEALIVSAVVGILLAAQIHAMAHVRNLQALSNERAGVVAVTHRVVEEIRAGLRPMEAVSETLEEGRIGVEVAPVADPPKGIAAAKVIATRSTPEGLIRVELMVMLTAGVEEVRE